MYEKKQVIVSSTMGLCVVADITRLSADKRTPILYYVLRSYYDKSKTAYIPVENHEVELREPISLEQAKMFVNELTESYSQDSDFKADDLKVGEAAYVLNVSPIEILCMAGAPIGSGDEES